MAIIVETSDPAGLLKAIYEAINDKKVKTWSYDSDGDFTHTPQQWKDQAWLKPKVYASELRFSILKPEVGELQTYIYAAYHGRFIEMLLAHFDDSFTAAIGTAQKTEPDNF